MKTIEIVGYYRKDLSKSATKQLRKDAYVPCELYGGEENIHFYVPMYLFKDLLYTPEVTLIDMNIEGDVKKCIIQDAQFHPVSEIIMHADFLAVSDEKEVKMEIPMKFVGKSPGMQMGGKLVQKLRKIKVSALPANLPDFIEVSIEGMDLGKSVKISSLEPENYTILNNPLVTIASIEVPRALRGATAAEGEEEGEEAAAE